jgi:hypothetical protein
MAVRVARHLALTSRARGFSALSISVEPGRSAESENIARVPSSRGKSQPCTKIELLQRPATSRLRLKRIAPTPPNAPGRIVCVSGNAPYPDRLVNAVSQALDIRLYCRPES